MTRCRHDILEVDNKSSISLSYVGLARLATNFALVLAVDEQIGYCSTPFPPNRTMFVLMMSLATYRYIILTHLSSAVSAMRRLGRRDRIIRDRVIVGC